MGNHIKFPYFVYNGIYAKMKIYVSHKYICVSNWECQPSKSWILNFDQITVIVYRKCGLTPMTTHIHMSHHGESSFYSEGIEDTLMVILVKQTSLKSQSNRLNLRWMLSHNGKIMDHPENPKLNTVSWRSNIVVEAGGQVSRLDRRLGNE